MVTLQGDKELIRKFRRMEQKLQDRALRRANGKAARPVVREMKSRARKVSKTISKSIGLKSKVYRKDFTGIVIVGVRKSDSVRKVVTHTGPAGEPRQVVHDPRNTFHLVDLGTRPHTVRVYGRAFAEVKGVRPMKIREETLKAKSAESARIYSEVFRQEILASARA